VARRWQRRNGSTSTYQAGTVNILVTTIRGIVRKSIPLTTNVQ